MHPSFLFSFNILFLIIPALVFAAPFPATSSSSFVTAKKGLFRSPLGFEISSGQTNWEMAQPSRPNPYVLTEYRSPDWSFGVQGALTVRVDNVSKSKTLKSYVNQWLRDYSRFGLKVTASRPIKLGAHAAYMIDMVNPTNQRQLRQFLFQKKKNTIILTCRAHQKRFDSTVKDCNQIAKNFRWIL